MNATEEVSVTALEPFAHGFLFFARSKFVRRRLYART